MRLVEYVTLTIEVRNAYSYFLEHSLRDRCGNDIKMYLEYRVSNGVDFTQLAEDRVK
jgi:hypothetical protein